MPFDSGHAVLHESKKASGDGLLLTHGAGADCNSPLLVRVTDAFVELGLSVLRCNLPFRQKKRFGPPGRYDAVQDRAGLKQWAEQLRERIGGRIFLGGHSYGGRQASILASEEPDLCEGLLLLSYPLHPPKKPVELRTGHFGSIHVPALFVQGDQDAFGTIDEMQAALKLIPARTVLSVIDKTGHDLARGQFDIAERVVRPFVEITL
jgi:uncharacterized protein